MPGALIAVFRRDVSRLLRRQSDLVKPLIFFAIVITLFGLGYGNERVEFISIAPTAVWIAVLLATIINLDAIFLNDYQDGTIEQLVLSGNPLTGLVGAKIAAYWVTSALPQIIVAVLVALGMGVDGQVLRVLGSTLLLGSPVLCLTGAIASALTAGLVGGALLLALLVLPLYMPTLIFATSAVRNAALGLSCAAELYFLAGVAVFTVSLAPLATAAALKVRLS